METISVQMSDYIYEQADIVTSVEGVYLVWFRDVMMKVAQDDVEEGITQKSNLYI